MERHKIDVVTMNVFLELIIVLPSFVLGLMVNFKLEVG